MDRKSTPPHRLQIRRHPSLQHILQCFPKMVMRAAQIYHYVPELKVDWVSLVAQTGSTGIALVVAFLIPRQERLRIVSWYVNPEFTNQGLGQQLLAQLEGWGRQQGVKEISIELRDGNASYDAASHILQKQGWSVHQPLVHRFKVAVDTLVDLHWEKLQHKTAGIEIFPWQALTEQQRAQLVETSRNDNRFPTELLPFDKMREVEYAVSLGLSRDDEVVGWIVASRTRPDLIEYSTLYVQPALRATGASILLLAESIRRLADSGAVNVILQVKVDNHAMLRLARKRFQPILSEATLFRSVKNISVAMD